MSLRFAPLQRSILRLALVAIGAAALAPAAGAQTVTATVGVSLTVQRPVVATAMPTPEISLDRNGFTTVVARTPVGKREQRFVTSVSASDELGALPAPVAASRAGGKDAGYVIRLREQAPAAASDTATKRVRLSYYLAVPAT